MCVGKCLTGGYMTMAAVLTTKEVADTISRGEAGVMMHGPTFMANPLACAVACASIDLLESNDTRQIVKEMERAMKELLAPARELSEVTDVRVLGSIGVVEVKNPVDVGAFQKECVRRGIWVRPFGRNVYVMPPYVTPSDDLKTLCEEMVGILRDNEK